jgi:hypothetical protein
LPTHIAEVGPVPIDRSRRSFWPNFARLLSGSLLLLGLTACNTVSSLHYTPGSPLRTAAVPSVSAATATDQRKEAPTRLATIMGGYGNPLKTLDTAKPVKDEVADAFTEGLRARGLLMPGGPAPYRLSLVVRKFDSDMIMGRTARIDLTMSVTDQTGRVVFQDEAIDSQSDFRFFQTGVFADIADLRVLAETVQNRVVDKLLDNPAFRSAVAAPINSASR